MNAPDGTTARQRLLSSLAPLGITLLCFVFGCAGTSYALRGTTTLFQTVFAGAAAVLVGVLFYFGRQKKLTEGDLVLALFLLVLLARLCYILDASILTNQHDTSWFANPKTNNGHTGYILYLLENKQLPDFSPVGRSQFYHPPLHHAICAAFLALQDSLGVPFATATENLQVLTLCYSMLTLYASYRILKLLGVQKTPLFVALGILGFHPTFFLFSGSINNDCLSTMLQFLAIWACLAWYKKPTFSRIIPLAFALGLAMLAKLNAGILAPAIAFLFLLKLLEAPGTTGKLSLIGQFAVFGVICIPLGIGWQVRNAILFDMPLTYVPRLSDKADQYLGSYSVTERFFDWKSLLDFGVYPARTGVQEAEYFEHCLPLASLKMALFGEYSVWKDKKFFDAMANVLFWTNLLIVLASLVGFICGAVDLFRQKAEQFRERYGWGKDIFLFFAIGWLVMLGSYVSFAFKFPHFCSMDFRYILPTVLFGCVWLVMLFRRVQNTRLHPAVTATLATATAVFSLCACAIYPLYY